MEFYRFSLSANEKVGMISNFSTMLSAGIPILEAVDSLLEGAKGNQKKLLQTLYDDLVQGKRVNTSFAKFPGVFDKVTINLIKASEEAGTLDVTLKELKETIKKQNEFVDKIKSALIYPIIIVVVFVAIMLLILTFVIPRISSVFLKLNVTLPLPTKILIFVSDLMLKYTIPLTIVTVAIVAGIILFYRWNKKIFLHALVAMPVVSDLAKKIDLARFCHSFYLLLNSGIPITTVLELTQEVVVRKDVAASIGHCKELVVSGRKLSEGFRDAKNIMPSIMVKITEAGEKTGSLEKSMQDISEYFDYEVSNSLRAVTALIEPVMLVVVGVLIGGMMLGIIAPIYGLIGQITPK